MEKQIKLFHVGNSNTFFSSQLPFSNAPCVPYITQIYLFICLFFGQLFIIYFTVDNPHIRLSSIRKSEVTSWSEIGCISIESIIATKTIWVFKVYPNFFCINFFLFLSVRLVQTKREDTYSSPGWKHVPCTSSIMCKTYKQVIGTIHSL